MREAEKEVQNSGQDQHYHNHLEDIRMQQNEDSQSGACIQLSVKPHHNSDCLYSPKSCLVFGRPIEIGIALWRWRSATIVDIVPR